MAALPQALTAHAAAAEFTYGIRTHCYPAGLRDKLSAWPEVAEQALAAAQRRSNSASLRASCR
ncbi:hypothetical protein GCM10022403_001290 [Streptomyces coacervatus]|uniref:Uncharacterized protein n=1 Tax=Streptomyces coacervatus TaxID=647381 RepID=A0ABP7GL96_9ACTN